MTKTLLIIIGIAGALISAFVLFITYNDSIYAARIRLHYRNHDVIAKAIFILTESHDRDSIPQIRKLLYDKDAFIRGAAITGLARIDDKESIPEIRKLLNNEDDSLNAIYALATLGDKESIPEIKEMLKDKNEFKRNWVEKGLKRLGVSDEEIQKAKEK